MATEEQYIEIYNKIGNSYFGKADDDQLKKWGNSEDEIRKIKINSIKSHLNFYKDGIELWKMMNELCGGKNKF